MRSPDPVLGSEEERAEKKVRRRKREVELLRISKQQAYKFLFEAQYELAIPSALQSLKFSKEVSGDKTIELVPSYLILGEASIGNH